MDQIIVGIIALVAAGYLFRRFRSVVKNGNASCGCGSCGSACGSAKTDCGDNRLLVIQGGKGTADRTGNR